MKKCFVLAALIAAMSISQSATAKDADQPNPGKLKFSLKGSAGVATVKAAEKPTAAKEAPTAITISSSGTLTLTLNLDKDGTWKVGAGSLTFGDGKKAPSEVKLERLRLGQVVMIGPDDKVVVREYSNFLPKEVLGKLPSEIREKLARPAGDDLPAEAKRALDAVTRAIDAQSVEARKESQMAKEQAFRAQALAAQIKAQALVADKERLAAMDQAMKAQTLAAKQEALAFDFQEKVQVEKSRALAAQKEAEALRAQAQKATEVQALAAQREIQAAKAQIAEALRAQVQKATEVQALAAQKEIQAAKARIIEAEMIARRQQLSSRATDSRDISAKLDKILERLDRLEKDFDAIKAKKDK